jgi:hypothetical protein
MKMIPPSVQARGKQRSFGACCRPAHRLHHLLDGHGSPECAADVRWHAAVGSEGVATEHLAVVDDHKGRLEAIGVIDVLDHAPNGPFLFRNSSTSRRSRLGG